MAETPERPDGVDITKPSAARIYDYVLGGSANFAVDREFADRALERFPGARLVATANRSFLRRAVQFCLQQGVRQFLDIGSGIPTVGNVHEVAQRIDPDATVVYVDYEPVAIAHSRQLLESNPKATAVLADAREPEALLDNADLRAHLDFDQPVAVLMVALLHFVPDADDPAGLVRSYRDVLAPGSLLVISHGTTDGVPEVAALADQYKHSANPATMRSREQVTAMMDGFEILPPGVVFSAAWQPDDEPGEVRPEQSGAYAVVGRRP
ncbi:SAM-dependent methyltransferase [Actinoalloteichus hymeniacidonis]|uniref:S-adenosyl methyltransferase n=1 Tax=Actinoalloteichus hymeniacidonis TaxID=340345 RepID=A0AAC9HPS1_9PSEU|nr:SAM-dependent methyltransferase [Actinoalloteichus hymeniacidonis]AOS63277.1 S-adenosyl methyltransferase [Actinoalloteichus hymeniacidonis]MBB5908684.1 SAM-dependent methyltransferase [Actinoalloteichus hymeniacidonis]